MHHADSGMRRGTVHTVHDAVVDIRFAPEWLPMPTSLLISTGDMEAAPVQLRVVAQLDHETVRRCAPLRTPRSPSAAQSRHSPTLASITRLTSRHSIVRSTSSHPVGPRLTG